MHSSERFKQDSLIRAQIEGCDNVNYLIRKSFIQNLHAEIRNALKAIYLKIIY